MQGSFEVIVIATGVDVETQKNGSTYIDQKFNIASKLDVARMSNVKLPRKIKLMFKMC